MINFVFLLIFGACWTWGIFCLFGEGYLLQKPGDYLRAKLPSWARKPLFDCPPCMGSVHGLLITLYFNFGIMPTLAYILALCGLNFIIKSILYPEYE